MNKRQAVKEKHSKDFIIGRKYWANATLRPLNINKEIRKFLKELEESWCFEEGAKTKFFKNGEKEVPCELTVFRIETKLYKKLKRELLSKVKNL